MIKILVAFSLLLISFWGIMYAAESKSAPVHKSALPQWLIGTWENKTSKGSLFENWSVVTNHEWQGKSYVIKDRDTIVFETINLLERNDSLFYIPVVRDQNKGLPVQFSSALITEREVVFENLVHDYPQRIRYTKITADSIVAEISGDKNGKSRAQSFPMKRIK